MDFSQELDFIIKHIKESLIEEYPSAMINLNYFILAVLNPHIGSATYEMLEEMIPDSKRDEICETFRKIVSSSSLSAIKPNREIKYAPDFEGMIESAKHEAELLKDSSVMSYHIFLAILKNDTPENKISRLFARLGVTYNSFLAKVNSFVDSAENDDRTQNIIDAINLARNDKRNKQNNVRIININNGDMDGFDPMAMLGLGGGMKKKSSALASYCRNLNEEYENGDIDRLIGRDNEIDLLCTTLSRRKKNSVIIVGAEGVGKTAICEGLAGRIANGAVPVGLMDKVIYSLNITSLIAGTQLRGMVEERVQGLINEVASNENAILFIDDIHALFTDKTNSDVGVSTMFSKALNDGNIQVIGATSYKGYHTVFDSNPGLARRFQKLVINPVTPKETLNILKNIKDYYENFHNVSYTDEALDACVKLGEKYITERSLPDSAIDIMDEAGALSRTNISGQDRIYMARQEEKELLAKEELLKKEDKYDGVDQVRNDLRTVRTRLKKLIKETTERPPTKIDEAMINRVVAKKTGIPLEEVSVNEKQKLTNMASRLKEHIIGQDEAIDKVAQALKRNRLGLRQGKCILSMLACGGTGVGKTLMAKRLAVELFGDESALVRFDMSEYSDKTAVNKLIGSNAGYVGYENGGLITEAIKNKKYCVLLLDEFEKADPEIFNLFLQVLDEGYMTDNMGQKVDFKNTIIIITSNIGAKKAEDMGKSMDFDDNDDEIKKSVLDKELKKKFTPEFLNRIDEIVHFNSLSKENLRGIVKLEIKKFENILSNIGHTLTYDDAVVDFILSKVESEKKYGARPIQRALQHEIEDKVADALLENEYTNHNFKITCFSDSLSID